MAIVRLFPNSGELPGTKPVLEIREVSKRYGRHTVLRGVDLELPEGIVGLLGPNGSGKSTLIKSLLGLVAVDSGQGRVLDCRWPEDVRILRDQVGYLPEDDCYIEGLQGIESIQMMARLSGIQRTEALRRSHEVADFCDMGQERYRTVDTYSTGMRQKLKFAQALVHDPRWLILDEPTTGLDPAQREQLLDRIAVLAREKGKSILLSTHILHDVQRVCDSVVILAAGEVRVVDSLERLQRPTQAGLQISVVSDADRLRSAIAEFGIAVERTGPGELRVAGEGDAVLHTIWKASRQADVLIQRIDQARNSLEQTFLDAVSMKDQAEATAGKERG